MEKVFLNTLDETSPAGIYGVNLFVLGQPHTIIVDDYLPVVADGKGGWNTHASKVGADGSLWGAVLEKALAKYHGNYHHTNGGAMSLSIRTLYGAPEKYLTHDEYTVDKLWEEMSAHHANGDIMLMAT